MKLFKRIIIFILLFSILSVSVFAADISLDGTGTVPISSTSSGGGGTTPPYFVLGLCYTIKVNLIRINSDENAEDYQIPRVVSSYIVIRNWGAIVNSFDSESNYGLAGAVYGYLEYRNGQAYYVDEPYVTKYVRINSVDPNSDSKKFEAGDPDFWSDDRQQWGFTFSAEKFGNMLNNNDKALFYEMLYESLTSKTLTSPMKEETSILSKLRDQLEIDKEGGITNWKDLQKLFKEAETDPDARKKIMNLQDYILAVEPVNHFQADTGAGKKYTFVTSKAIPLLSQDNDKKYNDNFLVGGMGAGWIGNLANNLHANSTYGKINENGLKTQNVGLDDISNPYSGYGYFIAKIIESPDVEPESMVCPEGTIGVNGKSDGTDTPYNNYYMVLTKEKTTAVTHAYSNTNLRFADEKIFDSILAKYNTGGKIAKLIKVGAVSEVLIANDSTPSNNNQIQIDDYYKYYLKAVSKVNGNEQKWEQAYYTEDEKNYYLYNSLNIDGNVTSTQELGGLELFKYNYRKPELSISSYSGLNDLNGKYSFSIGFTTNLSEDNTYNNREYFSPSIVRLSYCVQQTTPTPTPQPTTCDDTVIQATCNSTDNGTTAEFKENDNLAGCTLDSTKSSGFIMIDTSETNSYCEVACKDDIEISLPGTKKALAGTYFTLDNNGLTNTTSPVISATRTCVTSKIKYDEFKSYLSSKKGDLINAYNEYIDLVEYKTHINIESNITYNTYYASIPTEYNTCEVDNCSETDSCTHIKYAETCSQNDLDAGKIVCTGDYDANNSDGCCKEEVVETCTESDECPHTIENPYKDKTYTMATIKRFTATNGTQWSEITKKYDGYSSCTCSTCTSVPNELETYRSTIATEVTNAKKVYEDLLDEIIENINKYNECFNWNNTVTGAKTVDTSYSTKKIDSFSKNENVEDYEFKFKPNVSFGYEDEDGKKAFSSSAKLGDKYTYTYGSDTTGGTVTATSEYWTTDTIDNKYESGGESDLSKEEIFIPSCSGTKCTDTIGIEFYINTYVKRIEMVQYEYELPTVYTKVPSGEVSYSMGAGLIELGKNVAPVNINTLAGTYNYIITIDNLEDSIRSSKRTSKPVDRLQERFEAQVLNGTTGNDYVCKYDVINDIYNPDEKSVTYFYRIIDPSNINPNYRNLGYNWSDSNSKAYEVKQKMATNEANYQELIDERNGTFEFVVTSTIMKQIRQYNTSRLGSGAYSDWDLTCKDYNATGTGYHCESNFLTCLASGGGANNSCNSIFGSSLRNYSSLTSYDLNKLNDNRQSLINKQNALDGR